jgi:hypothetical protein
MRTMIVGAVLALALGFTVKDMGTSEGSGSPDAAWESRAAEANDFLSNNAVTGDGSERLAEGGEWLKEFLLEHVGQNP